MDQVPSRVGNVGEETGDEVESLEGLGLLAVVVGLGQVRGGLSSAGSFRAKPCTRGAWP